MPTIPAVSLARTRSEDHRETIPSPAMRSASSAAWRRPVLVERRVPPALKAKWLYVVVRLAVTGEHERHVTRRSTTHRVRAQAEAERLERQDLVDGDVAEVDVGAEAPHEPNLLILAGSVEQDRVLRDVMDDLLDQALAHLAVGPEDPGGTALASLGDHLPGAGVQLLAHLLDPQVRRGDRAGVVL